MKFAHFITDKPRMALARMAPIANSSQAFYLGSEKELVLANFMEDQTQNLPGFQELV